MSLQSFDLTNWRKHPTRKGYEVFFYKTIEEGNFLENLLIEEKIFFEKFIDEEQDHDRKVMIAVKTGDTPRVQKLNHLVLGKYRKPFIPFKGLRFALVALFFIVFTLLTLSILYSR